MSGARVRRAPRLIALAAALAGALLAAPRAARAQLDPAARWRTIATAHFRVHFTSATDTLARRAATSAERAYARLARELAPPRGTIDLVISDDVDFSNGWATPFPTNRIVLYAAPPVDAGTLRQYHDWLDLVVTHELTHVFHLDRTRGWWRAAQWIFGRNPALFPNSYSPAWLTEGLAVYYESRLTGSGRLAGAPHRAYARATALAGETPRLDQLSAATPAFPGGSAPYVYGSLLVDYMARTRGADGVRRFVDASAAMPIPFTLNHAARRAFGESFGEAWRAWRDSLAKDTGSVARAATWTDRSRGGWYARSPRWRGAGDTLLWAAAPGREVAALYGRAEGGRARRLGRRNSLDANVPLADGGVLFSQLEYRGPFHVRADLWVQRGRAVRRLTRDARLANPDARADGAIVAVQALPGTTRLVRLAADGGGLRAITAAHPDTQWAEPRWSPDGARIAAVRRMRGGRAEVVVLDSAGRLERVVSASDGVEASPAWLPDGHALVFTSDRRGEPELFSFSLDAPAGSELVPLLGGDTRGAGIFWPEPRPGTTPTLAAVTLRADGFHVMSGPIATVGDTVPAEAPPRDAPRAALADTTGAGAATPRGAARGYSPWGGLVPRYWLPVSGENDAGTSMLGASSSASDVVGRHAWSAQLLVPTREPRDVEGAVAWRWNGLGQPAVDLGATQEWDHAAIPDTLVARRAVRTWYMGLTLVRPRFYSGATLSAGGEVERRDAWEVTLLTPVPLAPLRPATLPAAYVAASWIRAQRALLGVSTEDGVSLATTVRQRWQGDLDRAPGRTALGAARAWKSFDLPGYARHVLALRATAAAANAASTDDWSIGGTSGGSLELVPGYTVGDAPRSFGVRGYPAGARRGTRALGGSAEWRAPLALAGRGAGTFPLFLARTGLTLFGDAAAAWCPEAAPTAGCYAGPTPRRWLASTGGELFVDAAAPYDVPYRVRLGVAVPMGAERALARNGGGASVYVTFGTAF